MHPSVTRCTFELDHPGGFASSPWAAVLGHHSAAAAAAAAAAGTMMQTGDHHGYGPPHHTPPGPMDLHMPQAFPYYRYREDALCWPERKPSADDVGNPSSVNARSWKGDFFTGSGNILELRKEKSRDAARTRRGKENYEFYELAKMLPLPQAITSQLDKASIIRLTISYLKLRDFSGHGDPPWNRDSPPPNKTLKTSRSRAASTLEMNSFEQYQGTHILQALDGFALALAADGRFLYISETVSIYLGLSQVEMTGSSVFDYIHHQDHNELAEQLGLGLTQGQNLPSPGSGSEESSSTAGTNNPDVSTIMSLGSNAQYKGYDRAFCIRMKSTLTKRGCHFKSSGYRVVLMLCRLRPQYTFSHSRKSQPPLLGMVAVAIALPPPSVHEIRLETDMFVTRINFDFRIAHCEPKVSDLLDYTPEELTGKNLYSLCHGEDANKLRKCHIDLINKGQVLTHYYRLMNKNGGYTWLQTCATVVCNSKNAEEQNIICVNYVISGREYENMVMDCCQMEENNHHVKREEANSNDPENGSPDADRGDGRNSGGPPNQPQDPKQTPNLEDSSAGPTPGATGNADDNSELRTRRLDHISQLQTATPDQRQQIGPQRGTKRKNGSSDEDEMEEHQSPSLRNNVISPASSSCHSTAGNHPISSESTGTSPKNLEEPTNSGTSVKDLEHAMSKHLPVCKSPSHQPTDFSTDALLKQQQKTTIQWIGTHHQQLQQQSPLPASALLRQLYANRESVIRANVHGITSSTGRSNSSSTNYYSSDGQVGVGPLPTPPSEGSSSYSEHQFLLSQHQNYPGGYSMDYHSAMTPPSSVSPRDKHQQLHSSVPFDTAMPYQDVLRHQYPDSPLPLKPQVYSYVDQPQFYHHGATGPGFHLYHPSKSTPAAPANWYSPS
ncbi:protein trachealess isoform X2 [Harmonia axyridis]|uniref:protein trachealess isoform X2 n=1 Tax=Harmonia axyridis TaxID=115357 RepID=UPI001E27893E|nr:protein trachealess isoform X2 [Harmonia axyridis]